MNMMPLVMANEQGRAQFVNLRSAANCSLKVRHQCERRCKCHWKLATERVKFPFFTDSFVRTVRFRRVAYFGIGAQNGR
jgi:hypothetical protein